MISEVEFVKLNIENQLLKKELAREQAKRKKVEQEYRELVELTQRKAVGL